MSVVTGIIISAVVIGLTVLFILWVLRRWKCEANESLGSRLWAYNESDISGNQLDRMRNMDDYFKHTNVKPRSMLIFAAVFICISILFIVFVSVLLAASTQRKSKTNSTQVSYDDEDPEREAFIERMQAAYEKYKKPTEYQNPQKTATVEKGKILPAESVFGKKEGNSIEIELVDVSDPEMLCIQELSVLEESLKAIGADNVDGCMDGVPFRGIQWPCVRMSYEVGGMNYYAVEIPIIEDEYVYKLTLCSDSEPMLNTMISEYIRMTE